MNHLATFHLLIFHFIVNGSHLKNITQTTIYLFLKSGADPGGGPGGPGPP